MPVRNFGLAQKRSNQEGVKKEYIFKNFLSKLGGIMNGTLNMNENRITNVQNPRENNDVVTKEYLDEKANLNMDITKNYIDGNFLKSVVSTNLDMKKHSVKNLASAKDNDDAVSKSYLDNSISQAVINLNKTFRNNFLSINKQNKVIDAKNNIIKNVADPIDDGDAVNKKHLNEIISAVIYRPIGPTNNVTWIRFFEMNLILFHTIDPKVFIIKGAIKIKQDITTKKTWVGNVPLKDKPTCPILLFAWHFEDHKTYDFATEDPQKLNRHCIIDQDKKLIVYGDLKAGHTLFVNNLISV